MSKGESFTLDVFTDVERLGDNQVLISSSGRIPSTFSWGDSFRSQRVDFNGIKLAVLVYPLGAKISGNGAPQVLVMRHEISRYIDKRNY